MYDFYRSKIEPDERMATLAGAGLPDHVDPSHWELMKVTAESPEPHAADLAEDIEARGFSYFKLVKSP
jgi:hypothetical protein